jgi:hypothetical protein
MLLSTSLARCEAAYKRAGVHTISLGRCGLAGAISEIAPCAGVARTGMGVDLVFEAVANILVVQDEFLALLLGPYRPAHGSDVEGWIMALLPCC